MPEQQQKWWQQALGAVPIVGPIIASAIQGGQNRRAIARQNEYNSPENQLQRIREAGLPYAAMTNNISGNQSSPAVVPDTGVQGGIQNYFNTVQQRKAIELMDAQIKATEAQAAKTAVEGNSTAYDLQLKQLDPSQGEPVSHGARMAKLEWQMRETEKVIQDNYQLVSTIDRQIKEELYNDGTLTTATRKQLDALIAAITRTNQEINRGRVMDSLIEHIKKDGIKLHEALIMAITTGQIGTGNISFPNINLNSGEKNYQFQRYYQLDR